MRRTAAVLGCAWSVLMAAAGVGPAAAQGASGSYIVAVNAGSSPAAVAADHGTLIGVTVEHLFEYALSGYSGTMTAQQAQAVAADPRVAYVVADREIRATQDPTEDGRGGNGKGNGPKGGKAKLPTGIDRIQADQSTAISGDGLGSVDVDVAILDTGIDLDHPDLNVAGGIDCTGSGTYDDVDGHGTHVAGVVGALDDLNGAVGVVPGARLWSVKVLGAGGVGAWSDVICGVDWVRANAGTIEVANLSLSGEGTEPDLPGCTTLNSLHDAICSTVAAGVTVVVSAGNDSTDAALRVPAAYDEVITVSALADFDGESGGAFRKKHTCYPEDDDTFAAFSNFGSDIDLIAPGVCIESTFVGGGYATLSGTSAAAPHVAGGAALFLAGNPGASPVTVKAVLQEQGGFDWDLFDDPDSNPEPLLNVAAF